MLMKLNKLIYSVRESLKEYTDDSELDDRYILHLLDLKRAKYIRQNVNNFQQVLDNTIIQKLCIPVEQTSEYICDPPPSGEPGKPNPIPFCKKILKSKYKIPTTFSTSIKNSLISVKGRNLFNIPFNIINAQQLPYVQYSKYNKNINAVLENDNYLYLFSNNDDFRLLECIVIEGVFESPLDLLDLETCCNDCEKTDTCFTYDSEYPVPSHLIDNIITDVINYVVSTIKLEEDKTNDSNND